MNQKEFLDLYRGKFIEVGGVPGSETAWLFNVNKADFSTGNDYFVGYIAADKIMLSTADGKVEEYNDEIILRQRDEIKVFSGKEELEKQIENYLCQKSI